MDSINRIKKIFTIIIICLSILFIINIVFFSKLYYVIVKETDKIVLLAIEDADNEELQCRIIYISSLSQDQVQDEQSISIFKSIGTQSEAEADESAGANIIEFNQLIKEVRLAVHQSIDSILPVNLHLLDSLMQSNFKHRGISAQLFYTEIIDLNTDNVLDSSLPATIKAKTHFYLYEYDTENRFAYKIYTESMASSVLMRMSGILVSAFLTIVLLGYAFGYFIRTVVRQKTLEEMKTDFTNNMTHELNTPISVAYSAVDTLLNFKQGDNKEKRIKYLNICIEQLTYLQDMVEHILSMSMERSKNIDVNKSNIELKPLLNKITEQQKIKTKKHVDIELVVQPENLIVYADRTHLHNIINNLIDNAIKYSPDNVIIRIHSYIKGSSFFISIKDNGIGISKENQNRIFDKFYRIPQGNLYNVKGYGLGLFYVKTMLERHKGEITVKSNLHKGTEFIIKIPIL